MNRSAPIRSTLAALAAGALLAAAPASAHEAHGKPMYGGVVAEAGVFQGELVNAPKGATLYLTDHGQPVPTAGATAKVVVLAAGQKTELDFVPAGDNRLAAPAGATLAAGAKAVATVKLKDGRSGALRFEVM
jgi:hypothetical protein